MKKIFSLSVFCLLLSTFSFAQLDNDQLLEDLLKMEQQLKQSLKGMGLDLDNPDMMDTLSLRGLKDLPIDIDGEMLQLFGQNMDMNLMMDMMMKGLAEMETMDLSQMEQLLRGFEVEPLIPAPDRNENGEEIQPRGGENEDNTRKKPKKKRKSYSL